jgi:hypothetical protein
MTYSAPGAQLARLEQQMQRRWFDLAMAEDRGMGAHVLERMFNAYMKALEAFVAAQQQIQQPRVA